MARAGRASSRGRGKFRGPTLAFLRRSVLLATLALLTACGGNAGRTYMVKFMPFAATPDSQGQATVQSAIAYAKAHPLDPIAIDGFHYGQFPNQADTMPEERVRVVVSMLTQAGVDRARIDVLGKGMAYAQGAPMPSLPPDTVKIAIGL